MKELIIHLPEILALQIEDEVYRELSTKSGADDTPTIYAIHKLVELTLSGHPHNEGVSTMEDFVTSLRPSHKKYKEYDPAIEAAFDIIKGSSPTTKHIKALAPFSNTHEGAKALFWVLGEIIREKVLDELRCEEIDEIAKQEEVK